MNSLHEAQVPITPKFFFLHKVQNIEGKGWYILCGFQLRNKFWTDNQCSGHKSNMATISDCPTYNSKWLCMCAGARKQKLNKKKPIGHTLRGKNLIIDHVESG